MGLDRDVRKAALGHRSDAANAVYERGSHRRAAADRAFAAYDDYLAPGLPHPLREESISAGKTVWVARGFFRSFAEVASFAPFEGFILGMLVE